MASDPKLIVGPVLLSTQKDLVRDIAVVPAAAGLHVKPAGVLRRNVVTGHDSRDDLTRLFVDNVDDLRSVAHLAIDVLAVGLDHSASVLLEGGVDGDIRGRQG